MNLRRHLSLLGLVIALGAWSAPSWAATTSHESHQGAAIELTLNGKAKWQGDENMLKGMSGIRNALATRLPAIHDGNLPPADYKTLASEVQAQVDFMVTNCKLAPEVDEQFHVILGHVLDGVAELEGDADPRGGAVRMVHALNAYGAYFEHPNWQPLE